MATITPRTTNDGCTRWSVLIRLRQNELREGRDLLRREAERHTLSELADTYLTDIAPYGRGSGSLRQKATRLRWWVEEIGDRRLRCASCRSAAVPPGDAACTR